MNKEEIGIRIAEAETTLQELMEQYSTVRKTDAETVKRGRLNGLQVTIGIHANKLRELKEQMSD